MVLAVDEELLEEPDGISKEIGAHLVQFLNPVLGGGHVHDSVLFAKTVVVEAGIGDTLHLLTIPFLEQIERLKVLRVHQKSVGLLVDVVKTRQ